MDDDIAVADSAIAAGLGGLLRREKATADPFWDGSQSDNSNCNRKGDPRWLSRGFREGGPERLRSGLRGFEV
jgi:hypothetical protein